jgi:hypothetical protein
MEQTEVEDARSGERERELESQTALFEVSTSTPTGVCHL